MFRGLFCRCIFYNMQKLNVTFNKYVVYKVGCKNAIILPDLYHTKVVTRENLNDCLSFRDTAVVNRFETYINEGQQGLYMYGPDGECIAHGWVILNDTAKSKVVNGYFKMIPYSAFIHFCNIHPDFRGKGLYKILLRKIYECIPNNLDIWIDTGINNIPARKGIEASGAIEKYKITTFRINSRVIYRYKSTIKN